MSNHEAFLEKVNSYNGDFKYEREEKINELFAGFGAVSIVINCDLGPTEEQNKKG